MPAVVLRDWSYVGERIYLEYLTYLRITVKQGGRSVRASGPMVIGQQGVIHDDF